MKSYIDGIVSRLWDSDAERGVIWALIVATVYIGIFGRLDPAMPLHYQYGNTPYGILWVLLSPFYWLQQPYMSILLGEQAIIYAVQWKLVKMGKIPKQVFQWNLFLNTLWGVMQFPQDILSTIFMPFATINPLVVILEILIKLPFGWSWNLQDAHVQCGFFGNCLFYNVSRTDIFSVYSWSHPIVVMWWILPVVMWWKKRHVK